MRDWKFRIEMGFIKDEKYNDLSGKENGLDWIELLAKTSNAIDKISINRANTRTVTEKKRLQECLDDLKTYDLDDIRENFQYAETSEDYNMVLDDLYDLGDSVGIWINTF